jgi:hypothetical protein
VTEEAGVGNEDSDEEVEDQGSGPSGNVVRAESKVGVLLVRLDGLGSQEKEDPDAVDVISEGWGNKVLCVLPGALDSSVGSEDEALNQGVASTREKTEC